MTAIDTQALRAAAEKATSGLWEQRDIGTNTRIIRSDAEGYRTVACVGPVGVCGVPEDASFIALANPQTILALLERLAAAEALTSAARRAEKHLRLHEGTSGWRGGEANTLAALSDALASYDRATAAQGEAT